MKFTKVTYTDGYTDTFTEWTNDASKEFTIKMSTAIHHGIVKVETFTRDLTK